MNMAAGLASKARRKSSLFIRLASLMRDSTPFAIGEKVVLQFTWIESLEKGVIVLRRSKK
jgi:hypothetical protein